MNTIRNLLLTAEKKALETGKEASAIKLLMQHATSKEGHELVANLDDSLSHEQAQLFQENVKKYLVDNTPIQHLMGYETFFGYAFKVNETVLIPRFETEELVEKVLALYDAHFEGKEVDVVDVGTGCGAIGITLALEESAMNVTVTDISESALAVAKENAKKLKADVQFLQSDMLAQLVDEWKKFDILVSNPPYIPTTEEVDALVYDNEPHLALFGGEDGLYFYRKILQDAHLILKKPSIIAFEHAYHHREGMAKLIAEFFPTSAFETIKDMQGKDRITIMINK
ncbi:MAG: peptide chain release factor N(5)-glutamine methyltransferase [Defluviitaleaceae bacterium]|nr:peptide chain release factor N(5)-glutamine methyltransferase [Defluviitaleaceae bacterium]